MIRHEINELIEKSENKYMLVEIVSAAARKLVDNDIRIQEKTQQHEKHYTEIWDSSKYLTKAVHLFEDDEISYVKE
ncbi:MAG: hypothetical protein E7315_03610 [Clostridiales bacterium]|nr:hypothetical protein [Clostridiales bacterium]